MIQKTQYKLAKYMLDNNIDESKDIYNVLMDVLFDLDLIRDEFKIVSIIGRNRNN